MVWNPEEYTRGNYFQNEISESFRKGIKAKLRGKILDVGCGDGRFSRHLSEQTKQGQILGIDSSAEMIDYANQHWAGGKLTFEMHNIEQFQPQLSFDFIFSFWCLHWTDISLAFPNIFQALKEGGRAYAVLSSFSDNSILQTWNELAKQERYSYLEERANKSCNSGYFYKVVNTLNQLPFKQVKIDLRTTRTYFPNLDYFKNLLLTMPFMKDFSEAVINDMLAAFERICERKYGGRLYYEARPIFLEALK